MYDDIINILNLNHSDVQSCTSKKSNNSFSYLITLTRKDFICPFCFSKLHIKDYRIVNLSPQIIRHLDTHIFYRKRRLICSSGHSIIYESNPFSAPHSSFSYQPLILIMDFLKEHSATFSMAARQFNTTPTKIVQVFDTFGQMKKLSLTESI